MTYDFPACLAFVLKWEGGVTLDANDPGGLTNLGIEDTEYRKYREAEHQPARSVREITQAEAQDIYRRNYWLPAHCAQMPGAMAAVMFDTAVNNGVGTAARILQGVLGVKQDGALGPETLAALTKYVAAHGVQALTAAFLTRRRARYQELVADNARLGKFLKGWLNRVEDLEQFTKR